MRVHIFKLLLVFAFTFPLYAQSNDPGSFGKSLKTYPRQPVQPSKPSTDPDVIKIKTELVASDVLVVSPNGNPLLGLKNDDFVVTENGIPQKIEVFSAAQDDKIGRSIILVIGYGIMILPYLHESDEAAKILIDKLGPHDKMAIVNDKIELLSGFTSDKAALKKTITAYEQEFWEQRKAWIEDKKTRVKTCPARADMQYSSLLASLNELLDQTQHRPVVIFETDGDEYPYLKPEEKEWKEMDKRYSWAHKACTDKSPWEERPFSFDDIKDSIAVTGATIYSVVPGPRLLGVPKNEALPRMTRYINDFNKFNGTDEGGMILKS